MTPVIDFSAMYSNNISIQAKKNGNKATLSAPHPTDKLAWRELIKKGVAVEACWTSEKVPSSWHSCTVGSTQHPDGQVKFRLLGDKELYNDY